MENENKTCRNCMYARQHYIVGCDGFFVKLEGVMHCVHGKITKSQFKKFFKENTPCHNWAPIELQEQENEHKIQLQLQLISKKLTKVIQALESAK